MHMAEDTRVFTDATHSSIRGCKNSIARLATESRAAWALENEEETKPAERSVYKRRYRWNERNLMQESSDNTQSVHYRYGQDGQRALKSSNQSETLYFNSMWSWLHNSSAYNTDRESKHIYLGTERLVTRMNGAGTQGNAYTAQVSTYYYHSDHLGSAQLITDNEGREYERIEYTPYGEYWVEKRAPENRTLPFKFTGKERDEETGLYYYGARYMDPRTSRWLSTDPALTDYIPMAPVDDNARKHNQNLPGMGGIYNSINMHLYHYAGNNPVKYTDPDGKKQNLPQKLFTKALSFAANHSEKAGAFIKDKTKIIVQRSSLDNGQNGQYFKSSESVTFMGIKLNSIDVQSTADYQSEVDAGRGRTISTGDYTGTLLNKSGSYNNAISITGNDVTESEAVLFHPNAKTAKGATEEYANGTRPYSSACQISHLADFNEVTDILTNVGFNYGTGDTAWTKGDSIKIQIKPPQVNEN